VVLPERNKKDVVDIPDQAKREMELIHVSRMDELLPLVLTEMPDSVVASPTLGMPPRNEGRPEPQA
jgi:ATP-dependent Lon protease